MVGNMKAWVLGEEIIIPGLNRGQDVAKSAKSVRHIAQECTEFVLALGNAPIMNQLLEAAQRQSGLINIDLARMHVENNGLSDQVFGHNLTADTPRGE
jgi:hypothetical protein